MSTRYTLMIVTTLILFKVEDVSLDFEINFQVQGISE